MNLLAAIMISAITSYVVFKIDKVIERQINKNNPWMYRKHDQNDEVNYD